MKINRRVLASITLSATALVALVTSEGYTDKAVIPVEGDVPTIGFGSTTYADGSPVAIGDTTTPYRAIARMMLDVQQFEGAIKQCVRVPLFQHEYDAFVSFAYNVGTGNFCSSTLVRKVNQGDYPGACRELLRWTYFQGKDCHDRSNQCYGLVTRRQHEYELCMGESSEGN